MTITVRPTTAVRLAAEAPLALGTVLYRAHDRLRAIEDTLELEATTDAATAGLLERVRAVRRDVAGRMVELASSAVAIPDHDCHTCLDDLTRCDLAKAAGAGACCSECSHG